MGFHPKKYKSKSRGKNGTEYVVVCPHSACRGDLHWNSTIQGGQCFRCKTTFNSAEMELWFDGLQSSQLDDAMASIIFPRKEREPTPHYPWQDHWAARWHLEKYRRLYPEQIMKAGIWYDEATDRICCPIHPILGASDVEGPFMSRHTDSDIAGWKAQPFGITKERHWYYPVPLQRAYVVLVEGIFDVLSPGLESEAIGLLGTRLYDDMMWWFAGNAHLDVLLWLDPDQPGQDAVPLIKQALTGVVRSVTNIKYTKEPGDCSREEAQEVIRSGLDART